MYSLFTDNIMISPANGQTALSSYLLRFGIFINNFTPTLANFSQWDANFMGSTGALGERVSRYGGQFSASNNSLYPAGSQLYMVAYNVAPDASVSTATHGVLLTHSNWILSGPSRVFRNGRAVGWTWYYYDVNGAWTAAGDMSESNIAGITSTSAFSSPFNTLSLGPSVAAGGVLVRFCRFRLIWFRSRPRFRCSRLDLGGGSFCVGFAAGQIKFYV